MPAGAYIILMNCRIIFPTLMFLIPSTALADLVVTISEASPTDLITIENQSDCDLYDFNMQLDLRSSAGGLIFDITAGGAGASVYQPFEILEGQSAVRNFARVTDGEQVGFIEFSTLEAGQRVIFMVDMDDTQADSTFGQTVLDGAEIAGAVVVLTTAGEEPFTSVFLPDGSATVKFGGCGPVS